MNQLVAVGRIDFLESGHHRMEIHSIMEPGVYLTQVSLEGAPGVWKPIWEQKQRLEPLREK